MHDHFTATAFVVRDDKVLLLWHRKAQMWLPPGGHLLPGEDPMTAAVREVAEETGLTVEVLPSGETFPFGYPEQLPPPFTILVEDSFERGEPHKHIDFIYFCSPADGAAMSPPDPEDILAWADEMVLRNDNALDFAGCGIAVPITEDVRTLALRAIDTARSLNRVEQT